MTEVNSVDGPIVTDLPAEAVADLQQPAAPAVEPVKEPEQKPEQPEKPVEPKTEDKPDPKVEPKPEGPFKPKSKPIANLLSQKHDLETRLAETEKAKADLEQKLAATAAKPAGTEASADIKALAEKYQANPELLAEIVAAARAGMNPGLPPEVSQLLKEREQQKQVDAELAGFTADLENLSRTYKDDKILSDPKAKERLQALAYSEKLAPDGQPYYQKPLYELYVNHVKPEFEPGQVTAEPSRGGTQTHDDVLDFQAIFDRDDPKDVENMSTEVFKKYSDWMNEKQGDIPIKHK